MKRYKRSLVQIWREWRHGKSSPAYDTILAQTTVRSDAEDPQSELEAPIPLPPPSLPHVPLLDLHEVVPRATAAAPILVQCSCGHTINASRCYAGKLIRCPRCQGSVQIPRHGEPANRSAATPEIEEPLDDCIRFSCRCGQAIKVPSQHAGHFGRCPQCGTRLQIPQSP
jgi:uncharacterized C2H2 Zn-finger protein